MLKPPSDHDIGVLVDRARAGDLDEFTRARIGGGTVSATARALVAVRQDCPLCGRLMLSTGTHDVPNVHHMAGAHHTAGNLGGWLMRASVLRYLGHACMFIGCSSCNQRAGQIRQDVMPSDLLHDDLYVYGTVAKPPAWVADEHDAQRRLRLGW